MLTHFMVGALLIVASRQGAMGQQAPTVTELEVLAARAAIDRHVGSAATKRAVGIDQAVAQAEAAPASGGLRHRDAGRQASLVEALGARTATRDSVVDCRAKPCRLRGVDVFATLAEPVISGNTAKVTVTTLVPGTPLRGLQYVTVNVLLQRRGTRWFVTGFEELGIS